MYSDKTILVTGGTGSFGNALVKRLIDTDIKEIRIFSRDEKKQEDMRVAYKNDKLKFIIGDVRNRESIYEAVDGADFIFHAAALKQVPSCEFFPLEAIYTNILGTDNLLTAAIQYGVKRVVCLSTDKAAYPINAMGISKSMMEKVFIAKSRKVSPDRTMICGTRYGNVMCSRCSVIPLFIEQIKQGKPMTITNPDMTRYLQTLEEAVELVLYAIDNGNTGDILVQKAPACSVGELAQALSELFGVTHEYRIIGARHGEKLYETLLTREEMQCAVDMGRFYRIPADTRNQNYESYIDKGEAGGAVLEMAESDYNSNNTTLLSLEQIKQKLLEVDYVRNELESFGKGRQSAGK